ncbi:protein of unknown function DUF302 [Hydrogenobacter thermophilus TK-6]|uniref:DUF302 domain-containing protein n=1 Tax=Hydrogenobacter thermophilus (strain DSM 6534 / IAM 12695 / TK-6) TaxID=608538 RepID=D3DIM2_HYDTT|nr:DUF302 domain-containing protein [Hydrogenobacter thermophilus]ADO45600.1 protein of unknown function DUF302 [Hydrogenobacter thermophilus TK-6]BAI69674.1 hypothetical protein HTH_1220 [Hydrogenobacter thermophilus TK-6]
MLINVESKKSVEEIRSAIEEKAKSKGFGVMAIHEVTKILESKGVPINYQCLIIEVCSPKHASTMLQKNPYVSTAMPCRIAVIDQGDRRILSTIAPTAVLDMFNMPEEKALVEEVEKLMKEIMEEAS